MTWTASKISYTSVTDVSSYTAYLIDNSYAGYTSADAAAEAILASGASASGVILSSGNTSVSLKDASGTITLSAAKVTLDNEPSTYAGGDKIDLYMVILDGDTASATSYMSVYKADASFNTSLNLTASFGNQSTATWTAVPEPTSGLLMLLGMAGMALRRRRA